MDKENDPFSEVVKDKLMKYTLPVDDEIWDKIEKQLNTAPPKKMELRWIAAVAVAASIALLFLLPINNKKHSDYETANQLSDYEETTIKNVLEEPIIQLDFPQNFDSPSVIKKSQSRKQLAENNLATEVIIGNEIAAENSSTPEEKEELNVPENHHRSYSSYSYDFEREQIPVIKQKRQRQSIRLSLGSGGNLLSQNSMDNSSGANRSYGKSPDSEATYFRAVMRAETKPEAKSILARENYSNVIHRLPLSLGITVKKELNQSFALESGVVYSFVSTSFSRELPTKSQAELQLHYIGIPLNLHTSIYKNRSSQWEVYLSAGGMVEKGILSHFSQKNYYDDVPSVILNEKIKGLQWSTGISPGIDFKIHKNYSIYLEPKLNYYFENDQPESARTQHPIVVGINAGMRYAW